MIIAGTGHRPPKIGGYKIPNPTASWIYNSIDKILDSLKPEKVISGMALGFDIILAQAALQKRIPLIAAIPFLGQELPWPPQAQVNYHSILRRATEQVIVSAGGYSGAKLQERNKWIVNNCDLLIACWDGSSGGTQNCVMYARWCKRPIIYLNPQEKTISLPNGLML